MAAGLAGLVGLAATPRTSIAERRWRRVVSRFDLPTADDAPPVAVIVSERHADGWLATRREAVVYIERDGNRFRALSATCTHLGCRVRWDREHAQYRCPCHGGAFDRHGRVVAGPPPAPLARVNVRVNPATSDLEVEL